MTHRIATLAVSETGFVFDPSTGNTFAVNATGLAVLRGLKAGRTLEQVQGDLADDFRETPGVEEHVRQFAQLLFEFGLLPEGELLP
ncbi:MAG TPA: PqqD family peptide modification chaperone [Polyangiaceae bacterium]|jgi:hypothetical protein|nr:PqqD family peptide modification chaperone [Polyangiaceae bacterium]